MTSHETALLSLLKEDDIFSDSRLSFDLREGVIWNPAKTRVVVLSSDLLTGIYKAVFYETGPGWKLIFQRCGEIWGRRLVKRLDHECATLLGLRLGDMTLENFLRFMRDYFVYHGWGSLTINVDGARETGLVQAELLDSIFSKVVDDPENMADAMICGMLSSLLGYLSGQELGCVQTQCPTKGAESSRFIITSPERLKYAEHEIRAGRKHEELVASI